MAPCLNTSLLRLLAAIAVVGVGCASDVGAQDATTVEQQEIKKLVETLAGAIDNMGDSKLTEARARLLGKGDAAMSALRALFLESRDDRFRTTAIGTMFLIENGRAQAAHLVKNEPADWHGHQWVFLSLNHLEEFDAEKARWVAKRALWAKDDRFLRASALGRLKRIGRVADVPAIEAFIARRQTEDPAGELRDGIVRQAQGTVREIQKRAVVTVDASPDSTMEPKSVPRAKQTPTGGLIALGDKPPVAAAEANSIGRWWLIGGALAVLVSCNDQSFG